MGAESTRASSVKIGHARGQNGKTASEQVAITDYYDGFTYCARANSQSTRQALASCMVSACNNNYIQYSQGKRLTAFNHLKSNNWDISSITSTVYVDCSSMVAICCNYAGIKVSAFTTSTMLDSLQGTGSFTITQSVTKQGRMVGDILWKPGSHTCIVVSISGDVDSSSGDATVSGNGAGAISSTAVTVNLQNFQSSIDPNNLLGLNDIFDISTETISREVDRDLIHTVTDEHTHTKSANLLSSPTYVEAPFVIFQVGDYKFGTCSKHNYDSALKVTFPNFISNMEVTKMNGTVNQYKISIVYAIKQGDDPNLVDRIFSTVGYGSVKISYGDWCLPSLIYKDEVATITKVTTQVDFSQSRITYTVECTSNAIFLASTTYYFQSGTFKPSDKIKELLQGSYGLQEAFPGMYTQSGAVKVMDTYIASDDQEVEVPEKNIDVVSYINFLTTYMINVKDDVADELKTVNYYMTLYDDTYNLTGGPYFKILSTETTIGTSSKTLRTENTYEIDVGYNDSTTSGNNVISFNVADTNSWALLYKYNDTIQDQSFIYDIDDNGSITSRYSPNILNSVTNFNTSQAQRTWWTQMTQFPITATLTMKGLVKPVLLMTYLRVNALFYGQRHVTSGLYTITKQVDTIGTGGFRTQLTLMRIAGDDDYIERTKVTETATRTRFYGKRSVDVEEDVAKGTTVVAEVAETASELIGKLFSVSVSEDTTTESVANSSQYVSTDSADDQSVWNYLMAKLNNACGVAGIMGNMKVESGVARCNALENIAKKNCYQAIWGITYTNDSYTAAVDAGMKQKVVGLSSNVTGKLDDDTIKAALSGEYKNRTDSLKYPGGNVISKFEFCNLPQSGTRSGTGFAQYGYGMCQWTTPSRKKGLYELCQKKGVSISDVYAQLDWLITELGTTHTSAGKAVKNATSPEQAALDFYKKFEGPPSTDTSGPTRQKYAREYYNKYA